MEPSLATYLALSGILFTIGATGVIFQTQRNRDVYVRRVDAQRRKS